MSSGSFLMMRFAALVLLAAVFSARAENYDILIRGARILDGSGAPSRVADIAVRSDRIAAVGDLRGATATTVIDATGLVAAPGFIDAHSHLGDHELLRAELAGSEPMLAQGVTTVLINSDGWGVPDLAAQRQLIARAVPGVNVAQMIGHMAVRVAVLAFANRPPNAADLDRMREIVRTGFERDGAFGLSTGLIYSPANFSKTDELIELARVGGKYGGFYHSHIRDESDATVGLLTAVEELITIAREAKVTGIVTHIKASGPKVWGRSKEVIERINSARAAGLSIWADQYPYEAGTTYLGSMLLPAWAQADGAERTRARLAEAETRAKIRTEMLANIESRGGAGAFLISRFERDRSFEGRRLDEIARQRGMAPVDVAIELLRTGEPVAIAFSMRQDDIVAFMQQSWTMTGSDGFGVAEAHPRSYGTFARKLRVYALEQKVISFERAIQSMTGQPAEVLGLRDRGFLREGAFADIVVFDPAKLRDTATYEQPRSLATGMVHVLVNGQRVTTDGKMRGVRAGRVLSRK